MTPYYDDGTCTIYHGEALDVLRQLPEASCDVLLTDPPYSSGGLHRSDRVQRSASEKYIVTGSGTHETTIDFSGDARDQRSWTSWVGAWMYQASLRVRPAGHAFVFTDWRQLPSASDAVQAGGWIWRGVVAWHKPNGGIPQRGRFKMNGEFAVWASNGPIAQNLSDEIPDALWITAPNERNKVHPTQKPTDLLKRMLSVVPGDTHTILDPFMGSGSTLVAAKYAGHRAIGIEIEERYCEIAANRLAQEVLPL